MHYDSVPFLCLIFVTLQALSSLQRFREVLVRRIFAFIIMTASRFGVHKKNALLGLEGFLIDLIFQFSFVES